MLSEKEIREKLIEIKKLKENIANRLWIHANPVMDNKGRELSERGIQQRISELAEELIAAYPDQCPVLVGVLVGAVPFASKLFDELKRRGYSFDQAYMQTSSYRGGMTSGNLTVDSLPKVLLGARIVIVVDDVCDTGKTYSKIRELFENQGAEEVHLMTLVDKQQERTLENNPRFSGFVVSKEEFIIGHGLDYAEKLRSEKEIRSVNPNYLPSAEEQSLLNQEKELNTQLKEIIANKRASISLGTSRNALFGAVGTAITPVYNPAEPTCRQYNLS